MPYSNTLCALRLEMGRVFYISCLSPHTRSVMDSNIIYSDRNAIAHRTPPLPQLPLIGNQSVPLAQYSHVDPKGFECNKFSLGIVDQ